MENIKALLIEKEREYYNAGAVVLAKFFADTLDYIVELEEKVNTADSEHERELTEKQDEINSLNEEKVDLQKQLDGMQTRIDDLEAELARINDGKNT